MNADAQRAEKSTSSSGFIRGYPWFQTTGSERRLHLLDNFRERGGIVIGDGGQHLAVDLDLGLLQAVDEPAVGEPVLAHRGVDALDPQTAEVALLVAPVAVGVL